MTQKTNKKRTKATKRTKRPPKRLARGLAAIKAFMATLLVLGLSAIGLWRCLDEDPEVTKRVETRHRAARVEAVDVGKGNTADPTLVNEKLLLEDELPEPLPEPTEAAQEDAEPAAPEEEIEEPVFPNHGVAFHFHTQLRGDPSQDAGVIAYARRGATFRLSERVSTKGCKKGWYEVAPGGLFICSGEGVLVGNEPVSFAPSPPPPSMDSPLPYRYAYVTQDNTPEYWRVPTREETEEVASLFARMAAREAKGDASEASETSEASGEEKVATATPASAPAATAPSSGAPAASPTPPPTTPETSVPLASPRDAGVEAALELPAFIHLRMARGYYVSTDDIIGEPGARYQRTIRGRFIPEEVLAPAKPVDFEGLLLQGGLRLPRAFVVGGGVKLLRRERPDGPLKNHAGVDRLSDLDYLGTVTYKKRQYVQVGENLFLPSRVVAEVTAVEPPEDLGEKERWIDVDLSEQTLVAYEGTRPVFATLVSTGREGFETPTGSFRIYSKHVTITMDDPDAGEEAYSIEDVPWVQYFKESYALHGAFWHNRFGRVRSHGCVNLAPKDARRLFFWTGPHLPEGIHGASATKENSGTRVVIHD